VAEVRDDDGEIEEDTHMTDPTRNPDTDDTRAGAGLGAKPGMPRWWKVSLIIALVLVLAFIILQLTGGHSGGPGPGGH
jgi:hypothetical protein